MDYKIVSEKMNLVTSCSGGLAALYLLLLPIGSGGYYMMIITFILLLLFSNRQATGIFCLLVGTLVFGAISHSFNLPFLGTGVSLLLGSWIISKYKRAKLYREQLLSLQMMSWLFFSLGVLFFSYLAGPQSTYSLAKLVWFIIGLSVSIAAILFMLDCQYCDLSHIGFLSIIGGCTFYASILYTHPEAAPDRVWIIAGLRSTTETSDILVATQMVSYVVSSGMVFLLISIANSPFSRMTFIISIAYIAIGFFLLVSCGQRLYILVPILSCVTTLFCQPRNRSIITLLNIVMIIGLVVVIFIGLQNNINYVTRVFEQGVGFAARSNRDLNWHAACVRINEKPLLGHGLGGYFIEGHSDPGQGTYPHNLILELLCETGIIGTLIILGPILLLICHERKSFVLLITKNGQRLFPWFMALFAVSMISHDLQRSCVLLGTTISALLYNRNKTQIAHYG